MSSGSRQQPIPARTSRGTTKWHQTHFLSLEWSHTSALSTMTQLPKDTTTKGHHHQRTREGMKTRVLVQVAYIYSLFPIPFQYFVLPVTVQQCGRYLINNIILLFVSSCQGCHVQEWSEWLGLSLPPTPGGKKKQRNKFCVVLLTDPLTYYQITRGYPVSTCTFVAMVDCDYRVRCPP